ncbi:uncharacterized protein HGUI_02703 [Hanseniaspora guilliermondii]|uniref:Mur ligase central domain-containing protein n=1 Tax=Hanseniaspora guilliermondii TaxID=56406 RepID=A0A1L0D063_9ASCO|nr:uncharacterized protein HGUI_02703 [Hanseniaspora guilliermondii]
MSIKLGLERLNKYVSLNSNLYKNGTILQNTIHVAGTNGKGSICQMISSILLKNNPSLKIGKFSSPYNVTPNDAISINGVSMNYEMYKASNPFMEKLNMTPFEQATMKCIDYFNTQRNDFNIMEVGCGGLLDSTNIIPAKDKVLIIINKISLDHTNLLGETLKEIAYQKAGVINGQNKRCKVLINGENDKKQVIETIITQCKKMEMDHEIVDTTDIRTIKDTEVHEFLHKQFKHSYQLGNAIIAYKAVEHLISTNKTLELKTKETIQAFADFNLLGRLTKVTDYPIGQSKTQKIKFLVDGSHNNDALKNLGGYIDNFYRNSYSDQVVFIVSRTSSKDLAWKNLLRKNDIVIVTEFENVEEMNWIKSASCDQIYQELVINGVDPRNIILEKNIDKAITVANANTKLTFNSKKPEINIFVVGSLYLAGKVFQLYQKKLKSLEGVTKDKRKLI